MVIFRKLKNRKLIADAQVGNKDPGDVRGNIFLITTEGVEAGDVSIDVIHLVSDFFFL